MTPSPLLQPADCLSALPGISPRELKALHAADMHTVADVLRHVPRRYEDRRRTAPIASLADGDAVSLMVHVYSAGWRFSFKRYYELSVGARHDPHGARLLLRWFNMPYIARMLAVGMQLSVFGKVRVVGGKYTMSNPDFEVIEDEDTATRLVTAAMGGEPIAPPADAPADEQPGVHTGRIVPIYRAVPGVAARSFRRLVWQLLADMDPAAEWEDYSVAPSYPLCSALRDLHFPADDATAHKARLRFALAECFERQFRVAWRRRCTQARSGQITATTDAYMHELLGALPFELTAAQRRCVDEIRADMAKPTPMNRLLQGDVGSGKTLVALCAMLLCVESGKTAALIAPTQILAEQHFRTFCRLLRNTDVRVSLRTADRADDSRVCLDDAGARDSSPRIVVGTHALLYEKNRPWSPGLAVIDEQHKFGVAQRERFIAAGQNPDVLVMTATPIPRTLTLTFYGDLDVSVIDELPANRAPITTALRNPNHMKRIIAFMEEQFAAGRQAYVVSPLIESSESRRQASAADELQRWSAIFPHRRVGLLHGRMSAEEKDAAMAAFRANETQLLVATTVVEVGVDVPNATMMLINDADSFGLSQLHQLRGRIGRGEHRSWCILLTAARPGEPGREKLEVLCRSTDGFAIAEEDFRLRGPGDVLGTAQSGLGAVHFAEWLTDARLIHRANRLAAQILDSDPSLSLPEHAPLRRRVADESPHAIVS